MRGRSTLLSTPRVLRGKHALCVFLCLIGEEFGKGKYQAFILIIASRSTVEETSLLRSSNNNQNGCKDVIHMLTSSYTYCSYFVPLFIR